jgi:hypothetical protein
MGSPPTCGKGEGLTIPNRVRVCYEILHWVLYRSLERPRQRKMFMRFGKHAVAVIRTEWFKS